MATINLKQLRELAARRPDNQPFGQAQIAITQSELAKRLGIQQSQVSRYEDAPDNVPQELLFRWLDALGVTLDQARAMNAGAELEQIDVGAPYASVRRNVEAMRQYARSAVPPDGVERQLQVQLFALLDRIGRKPNLVLTGPFDGAKSTLANSLLGSRFLPTAYQPTTRVRTYVRHLADRPAWMAEDVWVMSKGFDPSLWDDREHCERHRLVAGNLSTLADYGTHAGRAAKESPDAAAAMVYLDAPFLAGCNLVDLPGFDGTDEDDEAAQSPAVPIDVAIYVSPCAGFLRSTDLLQLGDILRRIPVLESRHPTLSPLCNLFIVATHATPAVGDDDLNHIFDQSAARAFRQLVEVLRERSPQGHEPEPAFLRARMFAFWRESPDRWLPLRQDVRRLMSTSLPQIWEGLARDELDSFREREDRNAASYAESYRALYNQLESAERELREAIGREPLRRAKVEKARVRLLKDLGSSRAEHVRFVRSAYAELAEVSSIERMLGQYANKKEAQEYAAGYLLEQLRGRVDRRGADLSRAFSAQVQEYLGEYDLGQLRLDGDHPVVQIPFNAQGAFIGGLSGSVAVGALALWAASLGNLGAYIIAAKVASLLSAIGISFAGGAATLTAALAAIGGPVTIAIGLVVLAFLTGLGIFGPSWQTRLARNIVKTFNDKNLLGKYVSAVESYWSDTEAAFHRAARTVESSWEDHLANLRRIVDDKVKGREEMDARIRAAEAARAYFAGLRWNAAGG